MTDESKVRIVFSAIDQTKPDINLTVRKGLGFQAICAKHPLPIEYDCRKADCGICILRVLHGLDNLSAKTIVEADFLRAMNADPDERLACQARVLGDVTVTVDDFSP